MKLLHRALPLWTIYKTKTDPTTERILLMTFKAKLLKLSPNKIAYKILLIQRTCTAPDEANN